MVSTLHMVTSKHAKWIRVAAADAANFVLNHGQWTTYEILLKPIVFAFKKKPSQAGARTPVR